MCYTDIRVFNASRLSYYARNILLTNNIIQNPAQHKLSFTTLSLMLSVNTCVLFFICFFPTGLLSTVCMHPYLIKYSEPGYQLQIKLHVSLLVPYPTIPCYFQSWATAFKSMATVIEPNWSRFDLFRHISSISSHETNKSPYFGWSNLFPALWILNSLCCPWPLSRSSSNGCPFSNVFNVSPFQSWVAAKMRLHLNNHTSPFHSWVAASDENGYDHWSMPEAWNN